MSEQWEWEHYAGEPVALVRCDGGLKNDILRVRGVGSDEGPYIDFIEGAAKTLISAAPELLAACKDAESYIDAHQSSGCSSVLNRLHAAIKKARGTA